MEALLLANISELVTPLGNTARRGSEMGELRISRDMAVYVENGIIREIGENRILEKKHSFSGIRRVDLTGKSLLPGFVDSHTHFVFAGYRPEEFFMRLEGREYMDIMRKGGGIQSTVCATRAADRNGLYSLSENRLMDFLSMGVTTVEGKSGYGLDRDTELTELQVMRDLNRAYGDKIEIVPTYLGAHAVPHNYAGKTREYIDFMLKDVLPVVRQKKLAEFVDVFCEDGVFDTYESGRLLKAAGEMGFQTKIHADEIASFGGAELAAKAGCTSADHLLAISDRGIRALAASKTVATLLPCTAFCLGKPPAPARKLIDRGCAVSLASDYNPGSCFTNSIPLIFALAVIYMKMTLNEAICALTLNGAAALGRADRIGSIEAGKQADMIVLGYPDYRFLVYHTAKNAVETVIKKGRIVFSR